MIGDEGVDGIAGKRRYVARVFGIDSDYPASTDELLAGVPLPEEMQEDL